MHKYHQRKLPLGQEAIGLVAVSATGSAPFAPYLLRYAQSAKRQTATEGNRLDSHRKPKRTPPKWVVFLLALVSEKEPGENR